MIRKQLVFLMFLLVALVSGGCLGLGNLLGAVVTGGTYSASGRIMDLQSGAGVSGVTLSFVDTNGESTATTDESGYWRKDGLSGTVTVTPVKDGWEFSPPSDRVNIASPSVDFVGSTHSTFSIQSAIDAAQSGDVVTVSPGIYEERINFSGKAITLRSRDPNDPDVVALTVIDAGKSGTAVTFDHGEGLDSVLEGFTIRNGDADQGGGILIKGAAPTVRDNVIAGNTAVFGGGAAVVGSEGGRILHNTFRENEALDGGAVAVYQSRDAKLAQNTIADNVARGNGGGVMHLDSYGTVTEENTFRRNVAGNQGGGLAQRSDTITLPEGENWISSAGDRFEKNVACFGGGGVAATVSGTEWKSSLFLGNEAGYTFISVTNVTCDSASPTVSLEFYDASGKGAPGGGMLLGSTSSTLASGSQWVLMTGAEFDENKAEGYGGAISVVRSSEPTDTHLMLWSASVFRNNDCLAGFTGTSTPMAQSTAGEPCGGGIALDESAWTFADSSGTPIDTVPDSITFSANAPDDVLRFDSSSGSGGGGDTTVVGCSAGPTDWDETYRGISFVYNESDGTCKTTSGLSAEAYLLFLRPPYNNDAAYVLKGLGTWDLVSATEGTVGQYQVTDLTVNSPFDIVLRCTACSGQPTYVGTVTIGDTWAKVENFHQQ